jgi:hypothetical protein
MMAADTPKNEPAFPRNYDANGHNGMTIRDWFAGQALTGLAASIRGPGCADWDYYGNGAYRIADAMIAAREEGCRKEDDPLEALKMLMAEVSETARPDGPLDPKFACPSMESAYQFARDAVTKAEAR